MPDSSGKYCYCTLDGYTPDGGAAQVLPAPWVFHDDYGDAGGEYEKSETTDFGILPCDSGLISPTGMWQAEQCGHALHIGDSVLYLRQTKQTEHTLHIQHGNNIFYGNATTADVLMNINTNHRLKVQHNNVIYSIHDDTIKIND